MTGNVTVTRGFKEAIVFGAALIKCNDLVLLNPICLRCQHRGLEIQRQSLCRCCVLANHSALWCFSAFCLGKLTVMFDQRVPGRCVAVYFQCPEFTKRTSGNYCLSVDKEITTLFLYANMHGSSQWNFKKVALLYLTLLYMKRGKGETSLDEME